MKTIILCGGKGTRLREYTESIPKPLIEIGGRPILWHIMKIYSAWGIKEFILALGYKGSMIKKWFLEDRYHGDFSIRGGTKAKITHHDRMENDWNITFANTGIDTPTGGRIKKAEKYIGNETFLATYGDGVSDININRLVSFHKKKRKKATITCVKPRSQFGIVNLSGERVTGFEEKPVLKDWVNGGFFVIEPSVFDLLKEKDILEERPFKVLAAQQQIAAFKHRGFWECMDTYKDAQILNELWSKQAPWRIWK